jgi:hypothetical protein
MPNLKTAMAQHYTLRKDKMERGTEGNSQKCTSPMDENRGLRIYILKSKETLARFHSIKPTQKKTPDPFSWRSLLRVGGEDYHGKKR